MMGLGHSNSWRSGNVEIADISKKPLGICAIGLLAFTKASFTLECGSECERFTICKVLRSRRVDDDNCIRANPARARGLFRRVSTEERFDYSTNSVTYLSESVHLPQLRPAIFFARLYMGFLEAPRVRYDRSVAAARFHTNSVEAQTLLIGQ